MQVKTPIHLLLISLSYIILIVLVNPIGDFPINDDWAYARSVLSLVEDGEFHLLGWGAMTLVSQVVWGALWVKLFGFSFDVLSLRVLNSPEFSPISGAEYIHSIKVLSLGDEFRKVMAVGVNQEKFRKGIT